MSREETNIARGQEGAVEGPTRLRSATNRFELRCGTCGVAHFADEETFAAFNKAEAEGMDNPFLCDECAEEGEASAHGW